MVALVVRVAVGEVLVGLADSGELKKNETMRINSMLVKNQTSLESKNYILF